MNVIYSRRCAGLYIVYVCYVRLYVRLYLCYVRTLCMCAMYMRYVAMNTVRVARL